jgi:hypothetical protein
MRWHAGLALLLLVAACAHAPPAARARRYPVPADVERLLVDDAAFAALVRAVRPDLEADVALGIAVVGWSTWRDRQFDLALLDALDGNWELAVHDLDVIAREEKDPAAKIMTGLTIRVWADARRAGGDLHAAFGAALAERVRHMPYELLETPFAMLRQMGASFTREVCMGLIHDFAGASAAKGSLAIGEVEAVLFQRYVVLNLVPVGDEIVRVMDGVIAAHAGSPGR